MKTVLHVLRYFCNGGTEKYLLNLLAKTSNEYKNIVLVYEDVNFGQDELKKMNVELIKINNPKKSTFINIKKIREIIKKENVDIVYAYTYLNSGLVMMVSFFSGIKIRITHSHRSSSEQKNNLKNSMYKFISKLLISIFSTDCLACGYEAGKSLFYRKFKIINNGIEIEKYKFNLEKRNILRKKFNISDSCKVIGMVGRLDENKNNIYMLKIFNEYLKINENSKLILVGEGNQKNILEEYSKNNNLENNILFLGNRNDVNELYNVFDLYAITSLNECLPFVMIEAQTNGLPCISTDTVDLNSNISGKVIFLPITDDLKKWTSEISKNICKRYDAVKDIIDSGYSLNDSVSEVKKIYEK